ncbi:hypothetical protein BKG96_00285 [Rodentibacter caecimuris]|uniref:Uncharacterized protein n=1 Tax=Rodentibacter caecimuris TaxID=1796644 RepID=A0A1V3KQI6_9PAST|nr:primase C-terminal domain-containing protein [Rodentibacter heylii]OOF79939.1 hypothetical protein BKG96_00285 [Rodentibacter heylii]
MAKYYPKNNYKSILNNSENPEKSDTFRIKISLKNNSEHDYFENESPYNFISMEEQRLRRNPGDVPNSTYPVILNKTAFATCSEHYSPACESLMNDFMNRTLLFVSEGKKKDGTFSPFSKILYSSPYRKMALLESTHFTFTLQFTDTYYDEKLKKYVKTKKEMYPVAIIDIDDFNGDYSVFERYDIIPNYLIRNPTKPKSLQVGYVLNEPVYKERQFSFSYYTKMNKKGNPLPLKEQTAQHLFNVAFHNLTGILQGDYNFKGHNAKNPFFATKVGDVAWTNLEPYAILDLAERSDLIVKQLFYNEEPQEPETDKETNVDFGDIENHILTETDKHPNYQKDEGSRNCQLFDEIRLLAYEVSDLYIETNAVKSFYAYLFNTAKRLNNEKYGLPLNEVKATIRSIVKYCFSQKLNAKYPSHQKRRLEKMNQIKTYMLERYGANHRYSKAEKEHLAQKFGVKPDTIKTYSTQIRKEHGTMDEKAMLLQQIIALRSTTPPTKWARIAEMLGKTEDNVKKMYKRNQGKTA